MAERADNMILLSSYVWVRSDDGWWCDNDVRISNEQ